MQAAMYALHAGWMHGGMLPWHGWMDGWMDGRMDVWIYISYACLSVCLSIQL